jgi:hypothetical protein
MQKMAIRSEEFVRINEAGARLRELVNDVAGGTDTILTDEDGVARAAIVDVNKLKHYRQLDSEVPSPFSLDDLEKGLDDVIGGHVLSEVEFRQSMIERLARLRVQTKK